MIVIVAKAGAVGDQIVESMTIRITTEVPEFKGACLPWEGEVRAFYDSEADKIVGALLSLPGGTLDRVLAKLITRSTSLHRIPWESPK